LEALIYVTVVGMTILCGRFLFVFSYFLKTNLVFSLVDLGEDNDRNLKMPGQIAAEIAATGREPVETAEKATIEMAEHAGEPLAKVKSCIFFSKLTLVSFRFYLE